MTQDDYADVGIGASRSLNLKLWCWLQRLLNYIAPDHVHVMESGKIIYSGGIEVAGVLEHEGYEGVKKLVEKEASVV